MLSTSKWRLKFFGLMALSPLVWVSGCGHATENTEISPAVVEAPTTAPSMAGGSDVSIDNFSFSPATITITAGTSITWVNHDDVPHTVTANDKAFGSKTMDTDDRYTHQFSAPGTYHYYCAVHPHMTGEVIVK